MGESSTKRWHVFFEDFEVHEYENGQRKVENENGSLKGLLTMKGSSKCESI